MTETRTLKDYTEHYSGCPAGVCQGHDGLCCTSECTDGTGPCSCGLDALLAQPPAQGEERAYRMGYRAGWIDGDVTADKVKEWEDGNWAAFSKLPALPTQETK